MEIQKNSNKPTVSLLKKHHKVIKKFLKPIYPLLILFIIDQSIFTATVVLFIINLFYSINIISYIVVGGSMYLLLRFTITNWFQKNKYFKCIDIFDFKLKIDGVKFVARRSVSFAPIKFWVFTILANFITAALIEFESSSILTDQPVLNAVLKTMLNVLLLPSFINSFNKIIESNKEVEANYVNLIKNQYFANETLFKETKFSENYLNLEFNKNNLTSKNGIFILTNKKLFSEQDINEATKVNEKILETYSKLWDSYFELLEQSSRVQFSKKGTKDLFWIERIYDCIFLDFLNI